MIIVIDNFASAIGADFAITWHGSAVAPARLVVATCVAVVVLVVSAVCTFTVAVCARLKSILIDRIRAALREGVIGALAVQVKGLKPLLALGRTLLVAAALVVVLVIVVTITVFAVVDTTASVLVAAVVVVVAASLHRVGRLRPAFAGEVFELASVALLEIVAHLVLQVESKIDVVHSSVVNRLEILGESL